MINGILGKKIGMTQLFDENGDVHPVTVLQCGPCVVTQKKSPTKDGYEAVQIGLVEFVKQKNISKGEMGHLQKNDLPPMRHLHEFAVIEEDAKTEDGNGSVKVGDRVLVDIFVDDKYVDISGTSKGRGFAGVVKRHKFGGGPKAHGHMFQVQGSIGSSSFPSRVFKGMKMPGHMGVAKVTVRNLKIRGIDIEENLLLVEGAVPGHRDAYVVINKAKKPPRERRGFAGNTTVDPLKAAKKAAAGKKK